MNLLTQPRGLSDQIRKAVFPFKIQGAIKATYWSLLIWMTKYHETSYICSRKESTQIVDKILIGPMGMAYHIHAYNLVKLSIVLMNLCTLPQLIWSPQQSCFHIQLTGVLQRPHIYQKSPDSSWHCAGSTDTLPYLLSSLTCCAGTIRLTIVMIN